jgi:hypothetical protein
MGSEDFKNGWNWQMAARSPGAQRLANIRKLARDGSDWMLIDVHSYVCQGWQR